MSEQKIRVAVLAGLALVALVSPRAQALPPPTFVKGAPAQVLPQYPSPSPPFAVPVTIPQQIGMMNAQGRYVRNAGIAAGQMMQGQGSIIGASGELLKGEGTAIEAQGKYEVEFQKSRLLNQEVERSKVDTRRKIFDERLYERANTPTLNDQQERFRREQVRHAQTNPPLTEILSGKSLNDLLLDCQILRGRGAAGPDVPLDEDLGRKVDVIPGGSAGTPGLLRGQPLPWPLLLAGGRFQEDRARIEGLLTQAVRQAGAGRVEADTVEELLHALAAVERKLAAVTGSAAEELGASERIRARRFLGELRSAARLLQEPDAAGVVAGRCVACGRTVPELVRHMTEHGLRFAPAAGGNNASYVALHRALASYDAALQTAAGATLPDRSGTLSLAGR
jgi:hypothetical protein